MIFPLHAAAEWGQGEYHHTIIKGHKKIIGFILLKLKGKTDKE